nr:hypothetical protein GCM10023233_36470 [Brevibacterium otitidis]
MVEGDVEADLLEIGDLLWSAGDADGAAALDLGDLPDGRTDRPEAAATATVSPACGLPIASSPE